MRVLQLNLNHCEAAQDLLAQTVKDVNVDVAILSEQYKDMENARVWTSDASGRSAIWLTGETSLQDAPQTARVGFTWIKVDGIYIYSVYASPNASQGEFEDLLGDLSGDARDRRPHIIAGDFNAWATEWGSRETNRRGEALLDFASSLDLVLLNNGTTPTFSRNGSTSFIDITFASESLSSRVRSWRVTDHYTHSDHQAIVFVIDYLGGRRSRELTKSAKWNAKSFDSDLFCVVMQENLQLTGIAEHKSSQLMSLVTNSCDTAMRRSSGRSQHAAVYWWNDEIAELRRHCHRTRRQAQRARGREDYEACRLRHAEARIALKRAIKKSKRQAWNELCDMVDDDPWGRPYKTVMARLNARAGTPPTCPIILERIISTLFPQQPRRALTENELADDSLEPPIVTTDELLKACNRIGDVKAPGPDGVPNVALKAAIRSRPEIFLETYNTCLAEGVFPRRWKKQRLVLIPKGNKPPGEPSSYRPICLLDTAGKVLERIIANRLEEFSEGTRGLSENQYGFRKMRSTVDAIDVVVSTARTAIAGKRWKGGKKQYCAIVALDVKNAFNSANWDRILDALSRMNVPGYIRRIISSYFSDRTLMYNTEVGPKTCNITGGVPQGSVLGPLLWNIMYDEVLRLPMPAGTKTIGFADDVAVVVVAKYLEEVTQRVNEAVNKIRLWLSNNGLQLANQKTEVVLVSSRKEVESISLSVGGCDIPSQPSLRYLGVQIDNRLRFDEHLRIVSSKAAGAANALARIMPNIGGPAESRRRLLSGVVGSMMLYAAPVWSSATTVESYLRPMKSAYRRCALRVARAFRTVSYDAACIVAGMPPIHLMAEERNEVYRRRQEGGETDRRIIKQDARATVMERWQQLWDTSTKGRWTHRLIPDVRAWTDRAHGETDHYLTQLLTGHGCFRAYQLRFAIDDDESCPTCHPVVEDVEHILCHCPRFDRAREILQEHLQQQPSPENIVAEMLASEAAWSAVSHFAVTVIKQLRQEEKERRAQPVEEH